MTANPAPQIQPAEMANLKRWASVASLSVALLLAAAKLVAFLVTDSISLLSSLLDSSLDVLGAVLTIVSIAHAATPADAQHRFGHGKMEALGALGQATFIFGSGLFLLIESARRILSPRMIESPETGFVVMGLSIVLTAGLVLFQTYVIRRTGSVAIGANLLNYKGDLLMNAGVLVSLGLSYYSGSPYFDPLFAIAIALFLLRGAYKICVQSFDILMDKELPEADRARILTLIDSHPETAAVHDLRTRSTGDKAFIEFHLELAGDMPLQKAHDISDEVEKMIQAAFPQSEVLVHQEPAGIVDERLDDRIQS